MLDHEPCAESSANSLLLLSADVIGDPDRRSNSSGMIDPDTGAGAIVMASRVLESQKLFEAVQPGLDQVDDMATKTCDVMRKIQAVFDNDSFCWCQEISFRSTPSFARSNRTGSSDNAIEGVLNVQFEIGRLGKVPLTTAKPDKGTTANPDDQQEKLRAFLSLSIFSLSKWKSDAYSNEFLFVVGYCQADSIDDIRFKKKGQAINKMLNALSLSYRWSGLHVWFRESNGKLGKAEDSINAFRDKTVFGMSHTGIR
jgi:hypothetical protein